jgi:hypothetical protein
MKINALKVVINMRVYIVMMLQFIVWSGYSLIEWLSKHDQLLYKVIMFFVFFYLAFLIGNKVMRSTRKTLFLTALSLVIYTSIHYTMALFIH